MITEVEKSSAKGLSQDQIDFFWKNGYLKVGKVFTDEEIALLGAEYLLEIEKGRASNNCHNLSAGTGSDSKANPSALKQVFQIINMCNRNIHFRKLLYDSRILDIVQSLVGPNIMLFHDQALYKPAHTGGAVYWHQDNAYWKCRPANLVSCWMTFDNVVKESGAMQVIPGSHLNPVWHETHRDTNALLEIDGVDTTKAHVLELPAGGIMFHHCQTLHYTDPNTTSVQRRAYAIHFMSPGTWSESSNSTLGVDFSHPMLRAKI